MNAVVIISANAEWRVVKNCIRTPDSAIPYGEFANLTFDLRPLTLFHGGWENFAAATTQYVTIISSLTC